MGLFCISVMLLNSLGARVVHTEPDDDHMDVRLAASLAFPGKGAMGKMNFQMVVIKEFVPENPDLLALSNRIGGNKGNLYRSSLNVLTRLDIPTGNIVEYSPPCTFPQTICISSFCSELPNCFPPNGGLPST